MTVLLFYNGTIVAVVHKADLVLMSVTNLLLNGGLLKDFRGY